MLCYYSLYIYLQNNNYLLITNLIVNQIHQDEITEMRRKLKIMNHQIDQLKEEISAKEASLVKEQTEHQRVDKEKEGLKVFIFVWI